MGHSSERLRSGAALFASALLAFVLWIPGALAASSETYASDPLSARLITAEDGIAPGSGSLSAGLHVDLNGDWKTYWRSPGVVGMPPSIDWSGSDNVASAEFLWPAPQRFRAFGIENFGYADEVVYPIEIALERPGEPARLRGQVTLLVCETICIPETFGVSLDLDGGTSIDTDAAMLIADHARRVPDDGRGFVGGARAGYEEDGQSLVASISATRALGAPDILPEGGVYGRPDIRLSEDGRTVWARFPVEERDDGDALSLTVIDGDRASTVSVEPGAAPPPPENARELATASRSIWPMLALAFLGGLILNVMPCVLPVLTLKLASVVGARSSVLGRVRRGFLASAAGVMAFVAVLALGTIALRSAGVAVGWGLQFQNAGFLAFAFALVALFAANMMGLFEFGLPSALGGRMARAGGGTGYAGDFATGAFAALLATPCSAPFLGTAVAFAFAGSALDVVAIFAMLGLGLAAP